MEGRRDLFTWLGAFALGLAIASAVMMGAALAQGVHCPACDRVELGDRLAFWISYFRIKDLLLAAGAVAALPALALARRRRWAASAFLIALVLFFFQPL